MATDAIEAAVAVAYPVFGGPLGATERGPYTAVPRRAPVGIDPDVGPAWRWWDSGINP